MNEFDKEEHTEDIWYSQIREILKASTNTDGTLLYRV